MNFDLSEYTHAEIELKTLESQYENNLNLIKNQEDQILLGSKKLDNMLYEIWNKKDKLCDEVWDFSKKHNFSEIFDYFPNIMSPLPHVCQYNTNVIEANSSNNVEMKNFIEKLIIEKNAIKDQIEAMNKTCEFTVKSITNLSTKLNTLKAVSEEMNEFLRHVNSASSVNNSLKNGNDNISINKKSISKYKEFDKNGVPDVQDKLINKNVQNHKSSFITARNFLETDDITTTNKITKVEKTTNDNIPAVLMSRNATKFSIKKRSAISMKYQTK